MEESMLQPHWSAMLPFVVLLASIALAPLCFADWWGKHYPKVSIALAVIVVAYYCFGLHATHTVLHTTAEYVSFIALIGSLFVISGGIHINVKGEATPTVNVIYLLIGAVIANFLGTTGASMLLIRPWIRMNKYRITAHHIVFFIFIVSNVGGCLTPIGDPPLFLGFLKGIPFWWVAEHCLPMWALGVAMLLAMFFVVDTINYRRAPKQVREKETAHEEWRFQGMANLFFLGVVLVAVFISKPMFLREALMIAAAAGSYFTTQKPVHEANHFNFHPIKEVAILFIGIFGTMMPALDWLQSNASHLMGDSPHPAMFFWGSGVLSSVLDNAPTYLAFLSSIFGSFLNADIITQVQHLVQTSGADIGTFVHGDHIEAIRNTFAAIQKYHGAELAAQSITTDQIEVCYLLGNLKFNTYILAISIGAVFFGANTYIGNGPNFMVKSIADHQKVETPSFVEYIWRYTLPFMLPVLIAEWLIFFRS
jgi:Na+/H+ antiporter NhaD/arsenite permease-like protein